MSDLLQDMCDARTPQALWRLVGSTFRDEGFDAFAYFASRQPGLPTTNSMEVMAHSFPPAIGHAYVDKGWQRFDSVPRMAITLGEPIRWRTYWEGKLLTEDEQAYLETMRSLDLGDGITFPVFGAQGRNGAVMVGRPVREELVEAANLMRLHMIAEMTHMRVGALLPDTLWQDNPLSAREQEILFWVARGKSNTVIAEILDLSSSTVDTYLRRIYEKLDVSDRTSAAVRGVGMGLIATA